jgi:hypothetical protein
MSLGKETVGVEKSRKATENAWNKMEKLLELETKKALVKHHKLEKRSFQNFKKFEPKSHFSPRVSNLLKKAKNNFSNSLKRSNKKRSNFSYKNITQKNLKNYENTLKDLENSQKKLESSSWHAYLNNPPVLPNISKSNWNSLSNHDKKERLFEYELNQKKEAVQRAKEEKKKAMEDRLRKKSTD